MQRHGRFRPPRALAGRLCSAVQRRRSEGGRHIRAAALRTKLGTPHVRLLNDLEATAYGALVLPTRGLSQVRASVLKAAGFSPATVATAVSGSTGVGGVVYAVILVILAAVAVTVLVAQWRRLRAGETAAGYSDRLMPGYGAVYLAVMVVLWITALPAYFGAVDGVTANGDPVGSLWYAAACLLLSALAVAAVLTVGQPALSRTTPEPIGSGSR